VTPGPLRTCLSTLGIVMGAASLVGVLSLAAVPRRSPAARSS